MALAMRFQAPQPAPAPAPPPAPAPAPAPTPAALSPSRGGLRGAVEGDRRSPRSPRGPQPIKDGMAVSGTGNGASAAASKDTAEPVRDFSVKKRDGPAWRTEHTQMALLMLGAFIFAGARLGRAWAAPGPRLGRCFLFALPRSSCFSLTVLA